MKTLFRQIKNLVLCKLGWHDWNDDGQCEHCKTWQSKQHEDDWIASTQKPVTYMQGSSVYKEQLGKCIHGEFGSRCPICRR
jgi:hypothetical protein